MKIFGTRRNATHVVKKPRRGVRIILALLIIFLAVGIGVYVFFNHYVRTPAVAPFPPRGTPSIGNEQPPEEEEPIEAIFSEERPSGIFTILVTGQDAGGISDTIMLAALDFLQGSVNVISIPRDTMVDVSWSVPKINSVIPMTNVYRLMEEVEKLTGFLPDFYVTVNLNAFARLVNAIDGVYFDVPMRMLYDDPYQSPPVHINLHPGHQRLDGSQALQLVRFRNNNDGTGYPNADLGRIQTQQAFLLAAAGQLLQIQNITRIHELVSIFNDEVGTNLPLYGLLDFAMRLMEIETEDIHFHTAPNQEIWVRGGAFVTIEVDPWLEIINSYFNPYPLEITRDNVRIYSQETGTLTLVGGNEPITPPGARELLGLD